MRQNPEITLLQPTAQGHHASAPGREVGYDFDGEMRAASLHDEVQRRQGIGHEDGAFSARFVLEEAASRYFALLAAELAALQGFLNEQEFQVVLNATASPVWQWQQGMTLAGAVADDHGIEALDGDTAIVRLVRKLAALTPSQCLALVDVCERAWRDNGADANISGLAEACGLKLG
jgi:hypothetical protein